MGTRTRRIAAEHEPAIWALAMARTPGGSLGEVRAALPLAARDYLAMRAASDFVLAAGIETDGVRLINSDHGWLLIDHD